MEPDAAPLVKEAQILACTRHKTDDLIPHLAYLDLFPVRSPALAAFAVELFRRFKYSLIRTFMAVDTLNLYEGLCGIFNGIVMNSTPCDANGELRREPQI